MRAKHFNDRLQGNIGISLPNSWHLIGYFFLFCVFAAAIFLALASYEKTEMVRGEIVLDRGSIEVTPIRAGIISSVMIHEGSAVAKGTPLFTIRTGDYLDAASTAQDRMRSALTRKGQQLQGQIHAVRAAADAETGVIEAQTDGLRREIASLEKQVGQQTRLVAVAESDFERIKSLERRGFASGREIDTRESSLISRQQQLSELERAIMQKKAAIAANDRSIVNGRANATAQVASINSSFDEISRELAQNDSLQGYMLTSPIDGIVTAIVARVGKPTGQQALASIMPAGATVAAELYVPTSAAGFLEVGQTARLAIDAYPFQNFGTVSSHIESISLAAVPRTEADGRVGSAYLVKVIIPDPRIFAFGKHHRLRAGMTLNARIVTQRQSLFEWLFEPLFALRNR